MRAALPANRATPSIIVLCWLTALAGCSIGGAGGPGGQLAAESISMTPVRLRADLPTVIYSEELTSLSSIYATDLPLEAWGLGPEPRSPGGSPGLSFDELPDGQLLRADVLWRPQAGRTPLDPQATNIVVRYLVVKDGRVGLYEGGGFGRLRGRIGRPIAVKLRNITLRLRWSSPGFVDALGPARLTADLRAVPDSAATRRLHWTMSQTITDFVGEPMMVDVSGPDDHAATSLALRPD